MKTALSLQVGRFAKLAILTLFLGTIVSPAQATSPVPVPEGMQGISGMVTAELVDKDHEKGELVMKVEKVTRLWRGNQASDASTGEGKVLKLTGIAGPALDQLLIINKGDRFTIEVKHVRGDNLVYLGEGLRKLPAREASEGTTSSREAMHGFRGIFTGTLTRKDPEKGTLSVKIDGIKRTWKKNEAKEAHKAKGQEWEIHGVSGKWVDVLFEMKVGERLEVEAFHNRGDKLDFVGEWLRKAEGEPTRDVN